MKVFLVVYVLINGQWVHGNTLDGWHEMEMDTLYDCRVAMQRGNTAPLPEGIDDLFFFCHERKY